MKNRIILFVFLQLNFYLYSQIPINNVVNTGVQISKGDKEYDYLPPKIIHTLEFGMSLPESVRYGFNKYEREELSNKLSFDLLYSINYPIVKKLTLGIVTGIQHQFQGNIADVKAGVKLAYYLKNYETTNFYIMTARNLGVFDKVANKSGYGNIRFGLQFRIEELTDFDNLRVMFNIFWDNDSYALKRPLLGSEIPKDIVYHGAYGLGIGLQF